MAEELASGDYVTASVRLVRPLAQGGMGTVWVADHLTLGMQVVVKLMSKDVEAHGDASSRFAREAAVAAAVKSPHVVQVFDSGITDGGVAFIVMELLEGRDLGAHILARGRLTPTELGPILAQLGKALAKAHRVGVVHRDLKPENVFLCDVDGDEPYVKLLDFGTAKDEQRAPFATGIGQLIGTPYYMSPEQILGESVDHRADIWSLGVVVYEALTGTRPFDGATVGAVTLAIHTTDPRPSQVVPELPATLDEWFARACARAPGDRFQSVRSAAHALVRAALGEALGPESSPNSVEDFSAIPPSSLRSTVDIVVPPSADSSSPLARATTTTLSSTLEAPRAKERRTMLWVAGFVAGAAALAMIALVRTGGGDRTDAAGDSPSASSSSAPVTSASAATVTRTGTAPSSSASSASSATSASHAAPASSSSSSPSSSLSPSPSSLPSPRPSAPPAPTVRQPSLPAAPAREVPPLPVFPVPSASSPLPSLRPEAAGRSPVDAGADTLDRGGGPVPTAPAPAASERSAPDFPAEPLPTMGPAQPSAPE
ncbi:MAG: hypothetical protein JWP97_2461 [Labilithrix sp.]|nr:hypothetical protein [Labilithrix sp.]